MASSFSIDTSLASDVVDSLKQTKNSLAIGNETLSSDNEYARQVAEKIIQLQNEIEQDYNTAINTLEKTITRTKQVENKLTNKARIELESANELMIESITTVSSVAETDNKSTSFEDSNSNTETNIISDSSSNFANETTNTTNKKTPLANKKTTQERITNDNFEEIKKEVEILKGATLVNAVTGDEITTGEELVQYMNEDSELQESFKQIAEIQRNNGKTIGSDVNQDELIKEENIEKYRELFDSADKKSNQIRIAEDNFEEIKNEIETLNGTTLINSKTGNEVTTGEELVEYMIKDANIKKYRKLFDIADKKTTQSRITEDNIEDFADEYKKKYQEYIDKCIKVYKKYRKMGAIGKETTAARISNDLNENYAEEIKSEIERYDTYKKLYDIYEKGRETTGARIFNDNTEDVIYAEMVKAAEKEEAEKRAQLEEEKENCWWDIVESILLSKAEGIFDTVVFGVNLFTSAVEWYDSLAAHQSREEYEKEKEEKWNNVYAYIAEENVKNLLYDVKVGILGGVEGALKFGEDVADGLWILINKLTSAVEWYDSLAAHQSREEYEKDKEEKWNEINTYVAEDHVGTWFNDFYDETLYGQILKEFSSNFEMVRELGNSVGYLGASIVSSALLTNAVGAVGGTVSKVGARVIKASTFATAQLGSATGDAWLSGASYEEALRQGFTTAGYRFIDMYTGDLIGEYLPFGTDTVEAIVKNASVHIAIDTGIGAIDGVVSPLIQSISTPSEEVLRANGYNPSAEELAAHGGDIVETYRDSSFADKYSYNFNANGGWKGVAKNAAAGGVMSAISEVIGGIKDVKDIKKATEVYDKMNAVSSELNEVVSNVRQMNYDSNLATEVYDTDLVKYSDLLQQRDEILTAYDNLTPSQQYIFQLKTIKDGISSSSDGVGKAFMSSGNNMGAIWKELNNSDRLALIDTMDESQIKTLFSVVGESNAQKFLDMNSDYFNGRFFTSDATDSFLGLTSGLTSTTDFTSDISFNVDTSMKTVDSDIEVKGAAQDIKVDTDLPNTKTDVDTSKAFTDTDSKIRQYENSVADAEEVYLQIADDAIDDLGTTETAINTSKNRALAYLDDGSNAGAVSEITDAIDDLDKKSKEVIEDLVGVTATTTSAESSYKEMTDVITDTRKELTDTIDALEQKKISADKNSASAYGELIEAYKKIDDDLVDLQNKIDIGKGSLDESVDSFGRDIFGETDKGKISDIIESSKNANIDVVDNIITRGGSRELTTDYIKEKYGIEISDDAASKKIGLQFFAEKSNDIDNSTSVLSEEFIKEQAMDGGVSYFEKKLSELIESKYSNDSSKNVLDKFKNKLLLTLEKNKLTKQINGDFNLFVSQLPSETINELFEKNPELTEIVYLYALNNLLTKENVSGNLKTKILSRNLQTLDNYGLKELANRYFYLIDSGEIDIKKIDTELLKDFACLDLARDYSEHPIIDEYFSRENFDQKYLKTILEDRGKIFTDETAQSIISRFKKELVQRYPDFNLSDLPFYMNIYCLQNIESYVSNYEYVLAHQDIVEKIFSNHMEYRFNFELLRDDNLELFDFDFIKENYDYMNSLDFRSSNPFVGKYREIMNIGCNSKAKKIYKEIVNSFDDESYLSNRVKTNMLLAKLSEFMKTSEFDNLDLDTFNKSDYIELYNYLLDGYNAALLYDADFKGVNYNDGEMISKKLGITFEKNYRTKYNAKCDELFAKTVDISEAKDILYMKYFETTRPTITSIMDRYGENFSKVMQFDESGGATEFIKLIETIEKCDDLATIREIYYDSQTIFYTQEMLIRLQNEVKQTYAKSILDVLKQTKEKVDVQLNSNTGVTYLSRGGKNIPIVKMQGDFNLLVHSTAAYGKMETIDGSYLKSWNNNKSNPNHGICCSLIGNNLLGMAPVANGGVMFGFFDFSPEALSDFSPYDLASSNHNYLLYTTWNPKYVSGTELIDNTRHGHNEIVIERRELRDIKSSYTAIQPDFLVYAPSNSGDNNLLLENTLNAASEMNIPVLTVDFEEIIDMEVENIYGLIDTFEDTKDLAQLHKALSAYETGRFDREHYLENNYGQNIREKLTNSFVNYIDYLKTLSDKKYVDDQFEQLREIISIEQSKYNSTPSHLTINSGSLMDYNMILKRMED